MAVRGHGYEGLVETIDKVVSVTLYEQQEPTERGSGIENMVIIASIKFLEQTIIMGKSYSSIMPPTTSRLP